MLSYPQAVTAADVKVGDWIRSFYRVVRLCVDCTRDPNDPEVSLVPLHGFSLSSNLSSCILFGFKIRRSSISHPTLDLTPTYWHARIRSSSPDGTYCEPIAGSARMVFDSENRCCYGTERTTFGGQTRW